MDQIQQLEAHGTTVSADTVDLQMIEVLRPTDATTNPTFLASVATDERYASLISQAITRARSKATTEEQALQLAVDSLCVLLGEEIAKRVPGYVSTEVDARLSFSTAGTLERARGIIAMYEQDGVSRDRVLIKVAGTWEGIQAAKVLEAEGIHTNVTLIFSFAQAVAAAQAGATLISPFVGRILDWHTKANGGSPPEGEDPGVLSVTRIYAYYKKHGYNTIVMGASFRNMEEIRHLAGVDRLTIAPKFLEQLRACKDELPRVLDPAAMSSQGGDKLEDLDEATFRWMHNEDACGSDKLAEGVRVFGQDTVKLENCLKGHDLWKSVSLGGHA